MAEERVQRRLAAILAADVVGYTTGAVIWSTMREIGTLCRMRYLLRVRQGT